MQSLLANQTQRPLKKTAVISRSLLLLFLGFVVFSGAQCPIDTDMDSVGDDVDNCVMVSNADQADADADGTGDACDNCSDAANADQADGDDDGSGNACDTCPGIANTEQEDSDGDGVGDACDNCPLVPNAAQGDEDDDGIGDLCEIADLVMADRSADRVFIYSDFFNTGPTRFPNVILDNTGSMLSNPSALDMEDNILVVSCDDFSNPAILIFNNFLSLTSAQAPSVVLDETTSLGMDNTPSDVVLVDNVIYAAMDGDDEIRIFRNVDNIIAGGTAVAPTVILNNAMSMVDFPRKVAVVDGTLYVANLSEVLIFQDVDTLATNDPPDVILGAVGSSISSPQNVRVIDNVLYVPNSTFQGYLAAFSPANGLSSGQEPDFFVGGGSDVDGPKDIAIAAGRLWIGQDSEPGLLGFDDEDSPALPASVVIGEAADFEGSGKVIAIGESDAIVGIANTLWGISENAEAIWGYWDPATMTDNQAPDVLIVHPLFSDPVDLGVFPRP